jgi:hypothetical protein
MSFQEQTRLTHAEAEQAFRSDDTASICSAIASVTLTDWDRTWLEGWCVSLSEHPEPAVRQISATCLGHIARRFRTIDRAAVEALERLCEDPESRTYAQDSLEDVRLAVDR